MQQQPNSDDYIKQELQKAQQTQEETEFKRLKDKSLGITDKEKKLRYSIIGEILMNVLLGLMTLTIIGLSELLSPDWNWSIYATSTFWISYGLIQSASWFARIWIYMTRMVHHEKTDTNYEKLNEELQVFVDDDFETPYIEEDAEIDNFNRKKRAWINKQKRKILKIANKHRITNILPYVKDIDKQNLDTEPFIMSSDIEVKKWFKWDFTFRLWRKNRWGRKQKRVNSKITRILKTITSDWVLSNIDTIKVKYHKVSRTILCNGYVATKNDDNTPDYQKNSRKIFMKYTIPGFIFMSFFLAIIVPLGGEWDKSGSAWFQFLTKAAMVLISGALMWLQSQDMFNATSKKAMSERVSTLNNYSKKRAKLNKGE